MTLFSSMAANPFERVGQLIKIIIHFKDFERAEDHRILPQDQVLELALLVTINEPILGHARDKQQELRDVRLWWNGVSECWNSGLAQRYSIYHLKQ